MVLVLEAEVQLARVLPRWEEYLVSVGGVREAWRSEVWGVEVRIRGAEGKPGEASKDSQGFRALAAALGYQCIDHQKVWIARTLCCETFWAVEGEGCGPVSIRERTQEMATLGSVVIPSVKTCRKYYNGRLIPLLYGYIHMSTHVCI